MTVPHKKCRRAAIKNAVHLRLRHSQIFSVAILALLVLCLLLLGVGAFVVFVVLHLAVLALLILCFLLGIAFS